MKINPDLSKLDVTNLVALVAASIGLVALYTAAMNSGMLVRYNFLYAPLLVSGDIVTLATQGTVFAIALITVIGLGTFIVGEKPMPILVHILAMGATVLCAIPAAGWIVYATIYYTAPNMFMPFATLIALMLLFAALFANMHREFSFTILMTLALTSVICASIYGAWLAERRLDPDTAKRVDVYTPQGNLLNVPLLFTSANGLLVLEGKNVVFIPISQIERTRMEVRSQ